MSRLLRGPGSHPAAKTDDGSGDSKGSYNGATHSFTRNLGGLHRYGVSRNTPGMGPTWSQCAEDRADRETTEPHPSAKDGTDAGPHSGGAGSRSYPIRFFAFGHSKIGAAQGVACADRSASEIHTQSPTVSEAAGDPEQGN